MRVVSIIILFSILIYSKSFEQSFNIQSVQPKFEQKKISKEFYGTLNYDATKIYDITLRFDGYIEKLFVNDIYQKVSKGENLFRVYSKEIYNLQKEYESLKKIDKRLSDAIVKKVKLYDISKDQLSTRDTFMFRSKFQGMVIEKNINEGSFAKAGTMLYKIADNSKMWVIAKVYQKDISFVYEGMDASISVDGVDENLFGKVTKIYPSINQKDLTTDVRIEVDNKNNNLYADMFAKVKLHLKEKSMLTLPKDAVISKDGKFYVFVKSVNFYEPKEIQAKYMGSFYQVFGGISKDQKVAKNALFLLDSDAVTNSLFESDDEW
jgi:Cu(I)/Ag(I) efflux system membrane fusion protein